MIYDTKEYEIKLEVSTDNFKFFKFNNSDTENIETYLKNIKNLIEDEKQLIIIFGLYQNLLEFDHWVDPLNKFNEEIFNPVIVFNGRLTKDKWLTVEPKFNYHRFCIFDHISNHYWKKQIHLLQHLNWQDDVYLIRPHKFYWASTKDWYSRRYILAGLIKNNLIQDNLVNYKCFITQIPSNFLYPRYRENSHAHIIQECESIKHLVPLPSIDNGLGFEDTAINFYNNCYLGLVTDTFFESGIFLSEKVFNAINYQQLFFYIGSANSLKYIRSLGYEIFEDIFDLSYDTIEDNADRLFAARKSLLDFLSQPLESIRAAYVKSIDKIRHNKNLVMQQRPDLKFTKAIVNLLNEH